MLAERYSTLRSADNTYANSKWTRNEKEAMEVYEAIRLEIVLGMDKAYITEDLVAPQIRVNVPGARVLTFGISRDKKMGGCSCKV